MFGSVPANWFMSRKRLSLIADLNQIPPEISNEYVRCFNENTIADDRAAAAIDCDLDTADLHCKIPTPHPTL